MKKYFSKDSFIWSTFDKKQKVQSLCVSLCLIILFIFASFTFFNAVYAITDSLGAVVSGSVDVAIKEILRSFPIVMSMLMSIWGILLAHGLFRNVDEERRHKSILKNSITLLVFAGVNLLFIIVGLIIGKYHSLVEGSPSPLYPLDSILFSLVYVALAVFGLIYLKKLETKLPYVVPSRGPIVSKARGLYCTFMSIWLLVTLFSFSCFWLGLFIYDFRHEYFFFGFAFLLVCLMNFFFLGMWEFYYNELKEENKKTFLLPLSICALVFSVISIALYMIGLGTNLDAPSNGGFGILPIAFSASVNIATLVIVFTPFIVSVVAFIKALVYRKNAKKEEK